MALAPSTESNPASPRLGLRANCLSGLENVAQAVGAMAPTGGAAVIAPLLITKVGTGTWFIFILILVIFFFISQSINTFASRCISAGSLATFVNLGLGPRFGIIAGWTYVAAMIYSVGSSVVCVSSYLDLLFMQMSGMSPELPRLVLLTFLVVALVWWTAHRDIRLSTDVMLYIEGTSIFFIVLVLSIIMFGSAAWIDHAQIHLTGVHPLDLQPGLVLAFVSLVGFESVTTLGEESKNALRTLPRVILACALPVCLFYIFVCYCLVSLMHKSVLSADDMASVFPVMAQKIHLPILGVICSVGVAMSFFACALACINAAARVLCSMAKDGYFWPAFGAIHVRYASPYRAVALVCALSVASAVGLLVCRVSAESAIDYLAQLCCFGFIIAYSFVCLAAPFFLLKNGLLHWSGIANAILTLAILVLVLAFNLFPIQPAPYCYFIFVFCGTVVIAASISFFQRSRTYNKSSSESVPYPSGKVLDASEFLK